MAIRQLPDGRWICYHRDRGTGKQVREYFGRGPAAETAARARNTALNLLKRRPAVKSASGPDFADCAKVYLKSKNFSDNSRTQLSIRLIANILPALGHRRAFSICDRDLDDYVAARKAEGVKNNTIHRELTDIKSIMNFAAKRHPQMIPYNPIRDYKKPVPDDEIIMPPTREEFQAILASAQPHLRRAILIAYYTGLRPGKVELLNLSWMDVNWESSTIMIRSAKKGGVTARQVPLHPEFVALLQSWHDEDKKGKGPIIHYHKAPVACIRNAWYGAMEKAGIKRRLRPYDIRHKFITDALERGEDIKTVSEIVGSSPATLMKHYQHVSNQMRRKTIDGISPLVIPDEKICMTSKRKRKSNKIKR